MERDEAIVEIQKLLRALLPSCVTCLHFNETSETCGLDPMKRRPPAKIIANGCASHDIIPF